MFIPHAHNEKTKIQQVHELHKRRLAEVAKASSATVGEGLRSDPIEANTVQVGLGEDTGSPEEWSATHTRDIEAPGGVLQGEEADRVEQ